MKFETHLAMESHPDFHLDANLDPIGFGLSLEGGCEARIGEIAVDVDEIPFRLAIPFLKRRGKPPLLGSIGGFKVTLSPVHVSIGGKGMRLQGVLGTKGVAGRMDGKVQCETDMDIAGKLVGRVGTLALQLDGALESEGAEEAKPRERIPKEVPD